VLAVDGLDLIVERGEVFGFLGPNGAGKSTTLRIMVGLVRPTRGSVRLFGHDVWREHCAAMRNVGAMIESPSFYKYLSGRDNLRILYNTGGNCTSKEINEALAIVGLSDRADDKVKAYSQGMRQRLGIALAIIGKPELILLDEPTNGLDPVGMKEVRDLIERLSRELNLTVFLSSHLLHEVEQVCTRIAVVNKGRVIESGKVSDLLKQSDTYDVHAHPSEAAHEVLAGLDWATVTSSSDGMVNVKLTDRGPAELNKALVERGIAVSALIPRKPSLEELYLHLMDEHT
jgi:ABC-type multidrug transport system ATPase subunit